MRASSDAPNDPAADPRPVPSSDGVTVALHDLGGDGPPLLLVHATGFHGHVWEPCTRHLLGRLSERGGGLHCWAPDLRGHGASPLPADAFAGEEPDPALLSWDRYTDDVLAVAATLAGDGTGLLAAGHSMGAACLVLAEQRRPGTFRGLYLYEPVIFPPAFTRGTENPLAAGARRRRATFESVAAARANYAAKPPLDALAPEALDAYVRHGFAPSPDGSVTLACTPAVEAATFRQGMHHGAFERLGEVTCPVTVASGPPEPGPATFAQLVAGSLPKGELALHPGLGHFGPMQDPAAIAAEMAEHLLRW